MENRKTIEQVAGMLKTETENQFRNGASMYVFNWPASSDSWKAKMPTYVVETPPTTITVAISQQMYGLPVYVTRRGLFGFVPDGPSYVPRREKASECTLNATGFQISVMVAFTIGMLCAIAGAF